MVVKSKPAVLANPVPPDIVEGRGDRSDPSQAREVNHQAVEFEVLCPILIKKCTKGQYKARTARSSTTCSGPKSKYLQACSGPGNHVVRPALGLKHKKQLGQLKAKHKGQRWLAQGRRQQ